MRLLNHLFLVFLLADKLTNRYHQLVYSFMHMCVGQQGLQFNLMLVISMLPIASWFCVKKLRGLQV